MLDRSPPAPAQNYVTDERARKAVEDLRSRLSAGGHEELARVVQQAQEQGKTLLAELQVSTPAAARARVRPVAHPAPRGTPQEENQSLAEQLSSGRQTLREVVGGEERVTQLTDTGKSVLSEHSGTLSSVHQRLREAMSTLSQDEETAHLRDESLTVMRDLARHRTTQELVQRAKRMVLESEEVRSYVNSVLGGAGEAVAASPDQYSERARAAVRSYAQDERTQVQAPPPRPPACGSLLAPHLRTWPCGCLPCVCACVSLRRNGCSKGSPTCSARTSANWSAVQWTAPQSGGLTWRARPLSGSRAVRCVSPEQQRPPPTPSVYGPPQPPFPHLLTPPVPLCRATWRNCASTSRS